MDGINDCRLMIGYNPEDKCIVANRPYLGGTVPIFYTKFPTVPIFLDCVPIFLDCVPIFLKSLKSYFVPKFSILTILCHLA